MSALKTWKIGRVKRVERDGDKGVVEFQGRVKGRPGPVGVLPFTVTPTGLRFGSPVAGPARWFLDFEGSFDCEETPEGTVVRHREAFSDGVQPTTVRLPNMSGWTVQKNE